MQIELTEDMVAAIVRKELIGMIDIMPNNDEGGEDCTDHEMVEHLIHVLAFYSNKDQFADFCSCRNIDHQKYI